MIHRSFRYRLAPTEEEAATLRQFAGVTRFVFNLCLEQRTTFWRQYRVATGGAFNFASQGREVTSLRAAVDWISATPRGALTQALRDLDRSYANFFSGRARYPTPRRKGLNDSFRIQGKETGVRYINRRWGAVRIPNLGWVKFRLTRQMRGDMKNATFSCIAGQWFVSFACEIEHEAPANDNPGVGIDRGIAVSLALSNGEAFNLPASIAALDKRKRRAQRILSRRKRGSARYGKQRRIVARIAAKIARVRSDWQHLVAGDIASRFGLVALEDLNTRAMTTSGTSAQKRGLNRSILEQGWGALAFKLAYKLEANGGTLIKVSPAYTSQTCSECGAVDPASRKSQSAFACVHCGFTDNADRNAAENILRRSTARVEGAGCGPVEALTMREAA